MDDDEICFCLRRWNAGLQLRLVRLHGGDDWDVVLQVPAESAVAQILGTKQTGEFIGQIIF